MIITAEVGLRVLSLVLGLAVGSLMHVLILCLPTKRSILEFLRQDKKSLFSCYLIVEGLTAVLFLAAYMKFGWSWMLLLRDWPFLALLVCVAFIDLRHRLIPDECSLGGLVLGLVTAWMGGVGTENGPWFSEFQGILGATLGFSLFFGLEWIYEKTTDRVGLGGGDIKFLAMIGAFEGPSGVFATMFVSSVFGSVVGMIMALMSREKESILKHSIPFGPFLVLGAIYYYLLGDILWFPFITLT